MHSFKIKPRCLTICLTVDNSDLLLPALKLSWVDLGLFLNKELSIIDRTRMRYPLRPCKSGQFTTERKEGGSPVSTKPNVIPALPLLCCLSSRHNAFSVTNSRCFPIVTLPSFSLGMCISLCMCTSETGR